MPLPQDDQEILVHTFIRIKEAGDKSKLGVTSFQVVPLPFQVMKVIDPVDIMVGEVETHFLMQGIDTT